MTLIDFSFQGPRPLTHICVSTPQWVDSHRFHEQNYYKLSTYPQAPILAALSAVWKIVLCCTALYRDDNWRYLIKFGAKKDPTFSPNRIVSTYQGTVEIKILCTIISVSAIWIITGSANGTCRSAPSHQLHLLARVLDAKRHCEKSMFIFVISIVPVSL